MNPPTAATEATTTTVTQRARPLAAERSGDVVTAHRIGPALGDLRLFPAREARPGEPR